MAKTLYLMRHASAMESYGTERDKDRELMAGGIREAIIIGKHLNTIEPKPTLFITSDATRAFHTTTLVADCIGYAEENIKVVADLYQGPISSLLKTINSAPESSDCILMVAHNPSISFFAEYITGEAIGGFSPASLVRLDWDGNWAELSKDTGKFIFRKDPEELV